ncbi:DNA replication and repair protein RecF [Alphaproteobacteria bacterium SO-S41]|nr:DNA replication and repair protein RecF [Alphaproteobacteria bacterium SO-S41]
MSAPDTALPQPAYAVRRLALSAFRSYPALTLEADARPVVLVGENGAGKTNILEALSLLSPGRGLRGTALVDSARRLPGEAEAQAPWAVAATVEGPDGRFEIGTGLQPQPDGRLSERRAAHINGVAAPASTALSETCRVVWLTPAMDRLFLESPGGRRRFLDRLTLSFEPGHGRQASAYERAMRERMRLLKDGGAADWVDAIEAQMAAAGLALANARARTAERLKADLAPLTGAFPQAAIAITGTFEETRSPGDDGEARFRDMLARRRRVDAEAGRSLYGPHTADLAVTHLGRGRPAAECSTGEQKALLIGLVLAAARAQARADAGAAPLLLLDEIAAHLDARRRAALFDEICAIGAQAWMTGTDGALFAELGQRAQGFNVTNGALNPI